MLNSSVKIRQYLLDHVARYPRNLAAHAMRKFNVTRTTVHRHLNYLIAEGLIIKTGTTKQIYYVLAAQLNLQLQFKLADHPNEFDIWQTYFKEPISKLGKPRIVDAVEYGLTEMINNAVDHSRGYSLAITASLMNSILTLEIRDDGLGAFFTLSQALHITDYRETILDLSKGKLTRDRVNHSGQGVFFTSRVFDQFELTANGFTYLKDNQEDDWAMMTDLDKIKGTRVKMSIRLDSPRDLISVFQAYQDHETLAFDRTVLRVELAQYGSDHQSLISRAQAKRIVRNISGEFTQLMLDFKHIRIVGQGFVDELFRVYKNSHPGVNIVYCNANKEVEFMIKRSTS